MDLSDAAGLSISLGLLHQWRLARTSNETESGGRKKLGAYYTPNHIVRTLIDEARAVIVGDESSARLATLSVCDPACGAGQFLVAWFEELVSAEVGNLKSSLITFMALTSTLLVFGYAVCRFGQRYFREGVTSNRNFFKSIFGLGIA